MAESNKVIRIMLTREMDRYTWDFLGRHPEAVVVHVGRGLDARLQALAQECRQLGGRAPGCRLAARRQI